MCVARVPAQNACSPRSPASRCWRRVDGAVLVIEARLSVNLNALTIEQARADCCHEKRLVVLTVKATPLHR